MVRFVFPQVYWAIAAALPSIGVGAFGLAALGWLMLTTPAAPLLTARAQIGVVIAPWSQAGMTAAARFDLPIIDLRWGGHLVVLDVSGQPHAADRLRNLGHFIINTSVPSGCITQRSSDAKPI